MKGKKMKRAGKKTRMSHRLASLLVYISFSLLVLVWDFPIIWTFLMSIKTSLDLFAVPPVWVFKPTLENYEAILFQRPMGAYMLNSMIIAMSSTLLSLATGTLAAYSLARFKWRGSEDLAFWILSTRMAPAVAVILPIYILMSQLRLIDTHLGVILAYTTFNLPFAIWMMRGFFKELPTDLEDSAMVDGCSRFQAFLRIVLPLVKPGLVATTIFCYIFSWNEFLFALVLTVENAKTLPVAIIEFYTEYRVLWGPLSCVAIISVVPIFVLAVVVQKYLVRGLTLGAIRG
jgi:multiple sugar transport system permease protein